VECGLQPNARLKELGELADIGGDGKRPQALNQNLIEAAPSVNSHSQGSYDPNESYLGHQQHQQQQQQQIQQYNNNERDLDVMPMALSTTQMISVAEHSAPPPTMDMVEDSFRQTSIDDESLSAPSLPPPQQQQYQQQHQQQQQQQPPTSSSVSNPFGHSPSSHSAGINPFGGPIPSGAMPNSPPPPPAPPQFSATLYGPGETTRSSPTTLTTVQTQRPSVHQRAASPYGNSMSNTAMNNSNHQYNAPPPSQIRNSSPYGGDPYGGESMTNLQQPQQPQQQQQMGMGMGHQPNRAASPFDPIGYVPPSAPMGSSNGGGGVGNQNYHNPFG